MFTYLNLVVALTAGVIVLDEPLTAWNIGGLVLILIGCVPEPDVAAEPTSVAAR